MVTPKDFVHRFYRMTNDLIVTQSTVESNSYCILNQSTYVKSLRKKRSARQNCNKPDELKFN